MTAFGAVDLFSGSTSLTGTNLWTSDKDPLNEITEGIDDVIGKQAGNATNQIQNGFQYIMNAIVGAPIYAIFGKDVGAAIITDVDTWFSNLENFLTEIVDAFGLQDLLNGDIGGELGQLMQVPTQFLNELLSLFGLGGLSGVESSVTGLAGELFSALSSIPADLQEFVSNVETVFSDLDFLSPNFNPEAAIQALAGSLGGSGLIPILQDGVLALENIPNDLGIPNIPLLGDVEAIINDIKGLLGNPSGLGSGNPILGDIESIPLLGPLVDELYKDFTGATAAGVSIGALGDEISTVVSKVETALQSAANSFNVTQTFGGLLHQLVEDLEGVPAYQGPLDFLEQIGTALGTLWGNILNSLSPGNPALNQTNGQVNYILAHLNPTTSNYRYLFDPAVPLSANYVGPPPTTNPAWTAPTGYGLPTVASGEGYIQNYPGPTIGVATGNPAASSTDHSLITDRVHVEMTVESFSNGSAEFFACGNGTTGLGQHVSVRLDYVAYNPWSYGTTLHVISYTGPMAGAVTRWSQSMGQNIKVNDVIALEYDNAGNFTVFQNGDSVSTGVSWADAGGAVTHGAGFRETGIKSNVTDNNPGYFFGGGAGPGFGKFVAYDF